MNRNITDGTDHPRRLLMRADEHRQRTLNPKPGELLVKAYIFNEKNAAVIEFTHIEKDETTDAGDAHHETDPSFTWWYQQYIGAEEVEKARQICPIDVTPTQEETEAYNSFFAEPTPTEQAERLLEEYEEEYLRLRLAAIHLTKVHTKQNWNPKYTLSKPTTVKTEVGVPFINAADEDINAFLAEEWLWVANKAAQIVRTLQESFPHKKVEIRDWMVKHALAKYEEEVFRHLDSQDFAKHYKDGKYTCDYYLKPITDIAPFPEPQPSIGLTPDSTPNSEQSKIIEMLKHQFLEAIQDRDWLAQALAEIAIGMCRFQGFPPKTQEDFIRDAADARKEGL